MCSGAMPAPLSLIFTCTLSPLAVLMCSVPPLPAMASLALRNRFRNTCCNLPELPWMRRDRYVHDHAMTDKEVAVLIESPEIADYFEAVVSSYRNDQR